MRKARSFERIPLSDARRRGGFRRYAPEVLAGEAGKEDFPPVWREKSFVKAAFKKMTKGHCAYCQTAEAAGGYGQVEHYQPKSLFPTLAYVWSNYFYSCELCNGIKSDKWPNEGGYVRPDEGDPSRCFVFAADGGVSACAGREDAQRMIEDFGLDRADLKGFRRLQINLLLGTVCLLRDRALQNRKRVTESWDMVRGILRQVKRHSPYSAAVRQNLRRAWNEAFPEKPV